MKPTTEGSIVNFDIVCMSFGKENKRGLKVVEGAEKNSLFNEDMIIKTEDGELKENNTLQLENGNIIKFEERAFAKLQENRKSKQENGIVINYEENIKKKKTTRVSGKTKSSNKNLVDLEDMLDKDNLNVI